MKQSVIELWLNSNQLLFKKGKSKMNFNDYLEIIKKETQIKMGENFTITITQVRKNNGIYLRGILIAGKDSALSPAFYLNDQYKADTNERNKCEQKIRETVSDIIRVYYDYCPAPGMDMSFFNSYEQMKEKVLYRLINYQKNRELLKEIPYKRFYDLAMVFYCDVKNDVIENGTILLYNTHLESWKVTVAEVYEDAVRNTPIRYPAVTQTMTEVMKELMEQRLYKKYGDDEETKDLIQKLLEKEYAELEKNKAKDAERSKMFVISNEQRLHGAAIMLYPDFLSCFAEQLQNDLYVLPSSVHEIIIVPAKEEHNRTEILQMVCEINATQVSPEEVLADTVYYYDRQTGMVEVVKNEE
jgi:hypothetical protein